MTGVVERYRAEVTASVIEVTSANDAVFGVLRGESRVSLGFAPGYALHVAHLDLASRVAEVLRRLFDELEAARLRRDRASGGTGRRDPSPLDRRRADYLDRIARIVACGSSSSGDVTVTRAGWDVFSVDVPVDAARRLGDDALAAALSEATEAMMRDRHEQVMAARRVVYHPELGSRAPNHPPTSP